MTFVAAARSALLVPAGRKTNYCLTYVKLHKNTIFNLLLLSSAPELRFWQKGPRPGKFLASWPEVVSHLREFSIWFGPAGLEFSRPS